MTATSNSTKTKQPKLSRADAVRELWRRGNLSWKLKPHQKQLYDLFHQTNHKVQTWLISRRSGKTYSLALLAIEQCIKNNNTIIKFLSPTKLQVNSNLRPIMRQILEDCPEELKPEFKTSEYVYYFPNGSEIQLAGSESGHVEKLRGGFSHIAIVDEAQDVTELKNAITSVLLPTTLTTKGKVLIAGTPPKDPAHEFVGFIEDADARGSLIRSTIYQNTMLDSATIEEIKKEMGGETTEEFRREFLCEIIKDIRTAVIPEFTEQLKKQIVREWPRPPYYDSYESMDIGFKDLTVVLFAYYDFRADKVVIDDEITVRGEELQLDKFTKRILDKEKELWTNPLTYEIVSPKTRVSDINYIVTQEISKHSNYQLNFSIAKKYDKESAINSLRVMLAQEKIIINPKCKVLIRHLENVKWDKSRAKKEFARSHDDGHYDAVDALLYLSRAIAFGKNPYPVGYGRGLRTADLFVQDAEKFKGNTNEAVFRKIFNIKKRKI